MKKLYLTAILFFATSASYAQFLGGVTVERRVLEERNDTLCLELDMLVRARAMNTCQSLMLIPELSTPDGKNVLLFPHVVVNGRNKANMARRLRKLSGNYWNQRQPYQTIRVNRKTEELVEYVMTVPYEMWMDGASLRIRHILTSCADNKQVFTTDVNGAVDFAPRTAYEPQLAVNFYEPAPEVKNRRAQGEAFLDFPAGKSVILPDFRKNPEELARIGAMIRSVTDDKNAVITRLYIEGYASPEGAYETNDRLSRDRSEALKQYIAGNFAVDGELIRVSSMAEDWPGFRALVEQSEVPDKDQVLRIIDSSRSPDEKEEKLKRTSSWFRMLLRMFPSLRRVNYQIDYTLRDFSTAEARELAGRNPDYLSHLELYRVANSYEQGTAEYYSLFDRILRQYPDDGTALLNGAAVMILRGDYAMAGRLLERVKGDPRAANNLGVLYIGQGDLAQARVYLERAVSSGVREAKQNLAELEKKEADDRVMERYLDRINRRR